MDVEFFAADPRRKSRPILEQILRNGTDQLAIACAFCTAAGVELLLRHAARLAKADSFVVVSAAPPTDYPELSRLHAVIPSRLFVHWGALAPVEIKNGAALMHSKVFYARAGRECWLWTGSHNLTGNATQGGNCEAAVLLHGTVDEQPFVDALQHLLACRNEATLYDPDSPPLGRAQKTDILVIHAEANTLPPPGSLPWRIHLCLNSAEFDELLTAPADVRLFLYPSGTLIRGWQNATPSAAYSGSLTGQNLTAQNPRARRAGTPAEWSAANFGIVESGNFLVMGPVAPPSAAVTTQAVLYVETQIDPHESLFSEEPRVEVKLLPGEQWLTPVDSDMQRFFRKKHVHGSSILHVPFTGRRQVIRVPGDEAREADFERIQVDIGANRDIPIEFAEISEARMMKRHPFIIRAKYRLPSAS
jgi:hypothetical protein